VKLLSIRIENLNSLYGDQTVDFEGVLRDAPLFLIVGPTGAGKSTIIDAISLALFGATSRLEETSGDGGVDDWSEPDARHVISRGCAVARSTVEFAKTEAGRRVRYRATWEVRRARKKADGAVQKPRRTLARIDPESGAEEMLHATDKVAEVREAFARVLEGMTLDDFHRCMVLPQGQFAAFLHATPEQRSHILERLTDTAVYRLYGEQASLRRAEAQREVDSLEERRNQLAMPDEAQLNAMRAEADDRAVALDRLRSEQERVHAWILWRKADDALAGQLAEAETEVRALAEERSHAASDLARLAEHERCADARACLLRVEAGRRERERHATALDELSRAQSECAVALQHATEAVVRSDAALTNALTDRGARAEEIARARSVWSEAEISERRAVESARVLDVTVAETARHRAASDAARIRARDAAEDAERAIEAWERFAPDHALNADVIAWRERVRSLAEQTVARDRLAKRREAFTARALDRSAARARQLEVQAELTSTLEQTQVRLTRAEAALREALGEASDAAAFREACDLALRNDMTRRHAVEELDRLRRESERLEEVFQRATLARDEAAGLRAAAQFAIEDADAHMREADDALAPLRAARAEIEFALELVSERHRLRHGEACPLCGSTDHPALHRAEQSDAESQLRARADDLESRIDTQTRLREQYEKSRNTAASNASSAHARCEMLARQTSEIDLERIAARDGLNAARARIGAIDSTIETIAALRASLDAADHARREALGQIDSAEAAHAAASRARQEARDRLTALEADLRALAATDDAERSEIAHIDAECATVAAAVTTEAESLRAALSTRGFDAP
jgi:exonuclease SbcC